jgi:hypothetical protein
VCEISDGGYDTPHPPASLLTPQTGGSSLSGVFFATFVGSINPYDESFGDHVVGEVSGTILGFVAIDDQIGFISYDDPVGRLDSYHAFIVPDN